MLRLLRLHRRAQYMLLLAIGLLLVSAMPPQATLAATKQQEINNALGDFKNGFFQRSSLANVVRRLSFASAGSDARSCSISSRTIAHRFDLSFKSAFSSRLRLRAPASSSWMTRISSRASR